LFTQFFVANADAELSFGGEGFIIRFIDNLLIESYGLLQISFSALLPKLKDNKIMAAIKIDDLFMLFLL